MEIKNTKRLPKYILNILRKRLPCYLSEKTIDEIIDLLSPNEIFMNWCEFEGFTNKAEKIKRAHDDIFPSYESNVNPPGKEGEEGGIKDTNIYIYDESEENNDKFSHELYEEPLNPDKRVKCDRTQECCSETGDDCFCGKLKGHQGSCLCPLCGREF